MVNSVEDELFAAIIKAGGVSEQNKDMKKVAWHRCSRTDKGVHAILNLISLKMLMEPDIVNKINQHLPRDIHLYGYKRVIASFNPKIMCNARRYDYLIPTFALKPDVRREEPENPDLLTVDQLKESTLDFSYRVDTPTLEKFRNLLSKYVGTKSFRNFTTKQKVNQSIDTQRYIIEYKCSDPIIIDGVEVVVATVHGASFIYNQIRKMIGFALCVIRGIIPEEEFDSALNAKYSCRVPTAPGDGLMLDLLYFDGYNKRHGGVHGNLEFSEYEEQMKKFKVQVFEGIVRLEKEKQEYVQTLCVNCIDWHDGYIAYVVIRLILDR